MLVAPPCQSCTFCTPSPNKIARRALSRKFAIDPPLKPAGRLKAVWNSFVEPRWTFEYLGGKAEWELLNDSSGTLKKRQRCYASQAVERMPSGFGSDQISRDAPEAYVGFNHPQMKEIYDVCRLSAEYCTKCEADEIRHRLASVETDLSGANSPDDGRSSAEETSDEQAILERASE